VPSLYRPKIVTYRLPDGSYRTPDGRRVTSTTPGAVRTEEKAKKWYGRYTDGNGKTVRVPLSESKEVARKMLAKVAGDAQMASVGIVDPFADHRGRPLPEHVEDFGRYLAAKGNTAEHVEKTLARCRAVVAGCRFGQIDDIQPSAVVEFLAGLREAGGAEPGPRKEWYTVAEVGALLNVRGASVRRMTKRGQLPADGRHRRQRYHREVVAGLLARRGRGVGVVTSNHYLVAVKAFSKWLVKDRRAAADPLAHLSRQNADADLRHPRRALREDAFGRFVEATAAGKAFRGLSGPARLVLYTLAANTGLRASELASLTLASFDLDATPPTVTVEAGYSKHRREDVQPLRPDVAEVMRQYAMRQYLDGRDRHEPLWPGTWPEAGAEMVRFDLAAADIPYQDEGGRFFDFHALRGQFISLLAAGGVHPKVAQTLARHSTITLTMDHYTRLDVLDVAGALDKLPGLPGAKKAAGHEEGRRRA
jgi:integrase